MTLADRITSFEVLGERFRRYHENCTGTEMLPLVEAARMATLQNPWFTPEHIRIALNNLGQTLTSENMNRWLSKYNTILKREDCNRKIGVVMAGNIPAVGFHDFLCVLMSGHKLVAKLSSADDLLLPAMAAILVDILPEWQDHVSFTTGKLTDFDAIIATGNTNTSRYFEFYFGKYPHIIRKNRNSLAVLNGTESPEDLGCLADDIMLFFGMGCRSISKIYVPRGYNFSPLMLALEKYRPYADHNKYRNNYEYLKSIFLVSQVSFIDSGFLLLKEEHAITSGIAVLHYEYYKNLDEVNNSITEQIDSIQCVISNTPLSIKTISPGQGQIPALWDYADQIDTMEFLLSSV